MFTEHRLLSRVLRIVLKERRNPPFICVFNRVKMVYVKLLKAKISQKFSVIYKIDGVKKSL